MTKKSLVSANPAWYWPDFLRFEVITCQPGTMRANSGSSVSFQRFPWLFPFEDCNFAGKNTHLKKKLCSRGHIKERVRLNVRGRVVCHYSVSIGPCDHLSVNQISHVLWTNMKPTKVRLHPNVRLDADVEIHLNSQTMSQKESLATLDFSGSSHRSKLNCRR